MANEIKFYYSFPKLYNLIGRLPGSPGDSGSHLPAAQGSGKAIHGEGPSPGTGWVENGGRTRSAGGCNGSPPSAPGHFGRCGQIPARFRPLPPRDQADLPAAED